VEAKSRGFIATLRS
jgi:hypothetical protein